MEDALARAQERLENRGANTDPSRLEAAFERARKQMEELARTGAELEDTLPEQVENAVREGLHAEAAPIARQLAQLRGLTNGLIRQVERLEQELEAERFARVEDLAVLVDLISSGWRRVDERLAGIERAAGERGATVYRIERQTGA